MKIALKVIGRITLVVGEVILVNCTLLGLGAMSYYVDKYGFNDGMDRFQRIVNRGLKTSTIASIGEKYTIKDVINYARNKKK